MDHLVRGLLTLRATDIPGTEVMHLRALTLTLLDPSAARKSE